MKTSVREAAMLGRKTGGGFRLLLLGCDAFSGFNPKQQSGWHC